MEVSHDLIIKFSFLFFSFLSFPFPSFFIDNLLQWFNTLWRGRLNEW